MNKIILFAWLIFSLSVFAELVNKRNEFGWKILQEHSATMGNVFLSPASVDSALILYIAGAQGEAKAKRLQLLRGLFASRDDCRAALRAEFSFFDIIFGVLSKIR
jgi:hypothetical protein